MRVAGRAAGVQQVTQCIIEMLTHPIGDGSDVNAGKLRAGVAACHAAVAVAHLAVEGLPAAAGQRQQAP